MRGSIHPARLTRSWRTHLLATALLLSVVSAAGCTGNSGTTAHGAATPAGAAVAGPASSCPELRGLLLCPVPVPGRVWHPGPAGQGIDGRGETVTVLDAAPPGPSASACPPPCTIVNGPATSDIRRDLAAFRLPAARPGKADPWHPHLLSQDAVENPPPATAQVDDLCAHAPRLPQLHHPRVIDLAPSPADGVAVLSARARLVCRAACPSGLAVDHRCRPVSTEIAPRRVRAQPPADRASWDGQLGGGTH